MRVLQIFTKAVEKSERTERRIELMNGEVFDLLVLEGVAGVVVFYTNGETSEYWK